MKKKKRNLREIIGFLVDRLFTPFWDLFYSVDLNKEKFEYSCFPLPFKINCLCCHGCCQNKNPVLQPPRPKGPYKVCTSAIFDQQYENLFGKGEIVKLWADFDAHNAKVDEERKRTEEEESKHGNQENREP